MCPAIIITNNKSKVSDNYKSKLYEKELILKHLNCCPPGDVPMMFQSSRYLQWNSKCARKHVEHTTHKTFQILKQDSNFIYTFLPFFADWWLMWEERKCKRSNTSWKKKEQDNYLWSSRALWTLGSSDRNLPHTLRCHSSCASTRWRNLRAGKEAVDYQ